MTGNENNNKKITIASALTVVVGGIMMVTGISYPLVFALGAMLAISGIIIFLIHITTGIATWADDLVSGNRVDIEWKEPIDEWDEDDGKSRK